MKWREDVHKPALCLCRANSWHGEGVKCLKTANWQRPRYTRSDSLLISHTAPHVIVHDCWFPRTTNSKKGRSLLTKDFSAQYTNVKQREQSVTFPQNWTHDKLASAITVWYAPVTADPTVERGADRDYLYNIWEQRVTTVCCAIITSSAPPPPVSAGSEDQGTFFNTTVWP